MLKNIKIATRTSITITLVLLIGFFSLWNVMDNEMSDVVEEQISSQMTDAVKSRAYIINNYVQSAEEYMIAFAKSDEVRNALLNQENEEIIARAQEYTKDYAGVKGVFEGLYIASTETHVLTHTSEGAIGIYTRKDEGLKEFQATILAENKLTNSGIMKSPSTGNMVISMYYPLFEGDTCIGYVGAAVYANQLMENLISLEVEGLPESEYVFLNVETGEYLYNENEDLLCTVTEDKGYLEVIEEIKKKSGDAKAKQTGMIEYTDADDVEQVIVYCNIPERNWVFALKDTNDNVYSSLSDIKRILAGVCIAIAVIVIAILIIILSRLGKQLKLISNSIESLGNMDLSANEMLKKYSGQRDEIGIVCNALDRTCNNLKKYIGEVDKQLSIMSEGDFTRTSESEFAGEFVKLQDSMNTIQHSLRDSFWKINTITSELVLGAQSVADSSGNLASAASQANMLLAEIDEHVSDISGELSESADFASNARKEANDAAVLVENSRIKMDELSKAMENIQEATDAIEGISNNLEGIAKQTNILALNALVEASRAGDAGRGFGVVADQIRVLAEQSSDAAKNAFDLINQTTERVKDGLRIGAETADYLDQVVSQTNTIDSSVTKIAESIGAQNDKLHNINSRLVDIQHSVEVTAGMAQQGAAASVELDEQINSLRDNISQYQV